MRRNIMVGYDLVGWFNDEAKGLILFREEGLLLGLPINQLASLIARQTLVGDALLLTTKEAAQC